MSIAFTTAIAAGAFIAGGIVGFTVAKLSDFDLPPMDDDRFSESGQPQFYRPNAKQQPVDYVKNAKGGYPLPYTTPPQTAEAVMRNKLAAELRSTPHRVCLQPNSCQCKPHHPCTFGSMPK